VSLWTIILAGGEGIRLRPLTRRICGDDRPKQYVPLLEARSLLGQTLDRAARITPPERTVVVTQRRHSKYIADEFRARPVPRVLIQPDDRGTAAGARCLPVLHERLAGIERFAGSEHEPWAIHQAYAYAPRASFSRAVLEACPSLLAVSRLPALTWCDLGSSERVMRTLASTGLAPAWLAALGEPA